MMHAHPIWGTEGHSLRSVMLARRAATHSSITAETASYLQKPLGCEVAAK